MNNIIKMGYPIFLIPLFLISGSFIPDLSLTLSTVFFLIILFSNKRYDIFNNIYFIYFFAFWIFISLNSIISENFTSIKSSLTYLRFGIFLCLLNYLFIHDTNFSKNLRKVILFSILILFIDSIIQYYFGYNVLGLPASGRISSFFGDEKIMGSYIIKILPIYLSLYYFKKKKINLDIHIVLILIICALLILLAKERSALGLFILYIFLISFVFLNKLKHFIIYFFSIFIFFIFLVLNSDNIYDRFIFQTIEGIKIEKNIQDISDELIIEKKKKFYFFTKAHDSYIVTSYNMFLDKPFVGHGTKSFRYKCSDFKFQSKDNYKYPCNTHPHNYYFQMLAENGLIGFLFLLLTFLYFLIKYLKNLYKGNKKKLVNLFIIPNIVNLWPIIPNGNFFNNWLSITIFMSLGLYIGYINWVRSKNY
jgi:O-antigen ligase